MAISPIVAMRYLKTNRENRFFSWIAFLSIIGIAIGVAAMIVVLSVINGFESELRSRFLAANAHILAYRFPAGLKNPDLWQKTIEEKFGKYISGVAPFVHFDTMGRKDYIIHAMLIKGVAPEKRKHVQDLGNIIRPKTALNSLQAEIQLSEDGLSLPKVPSIIIGKGLASIMQVNVGDTIELISPKMESDNPFGQLKPFKVVGLYDSGLQHYDNKLGILSIPAAQELFNMGDIVTGIEIGLKNPNNSPEIAGLMSQEFQISIKEWQSYNRNIFEAMRNERTVIGLIVALVAFVASFNILTTLFVSVTQKQRDIAVLKALGATNGQVLVLFIKQSTFIGTIGGILGVLLALFLAKVLETIPFIRLPDIYLLSNLPVSYDWRVYLGVTLSGIGIATVAGIYPAITATRVSPTDGLREGRRH